MIWAGYHEDDLAEHYRAADILLFTARGSDEGHRAVLEAMACGIAPVTFPIEGVPALLGDLAPRLIAEASTPESAAAKVIAASNDLANSSPHARTSSRRTSDTRKRRRGSSRFTLVILNRRSREREARNRRRTVKDLKLRNSS